MKKGTCTTSRKLRSTSLLTLALLSLPLILISCHRYEADVSTVADDVTIVKPSDATAAENLAAKEIRRYLYLRTGKLLPIVQSNNKLPSKTSLIVIGQKCRPAIKALSGKDKKLASAVASLESQQYLLKTITFRKRPAVLITGGDSIGTLYAAYRFAELMGVRFYVCAFICTATQFQISKSLWKYPNSMKRASHYSTCGEFSRFTISPKARTGGIPMTIKPSLGNYPRCV